MTAGGNTMTKEGNPQEELPPAKLYKYRNMPRPGAEEEKWRRLETRGVLYFSPPSKLNDPVDCRPTFQLDASEQDMLEYFKRRARGRSKEQRAWAAQRIQDENWWYKYWQREADRHGHYCLAASRDVPLMWGHYANGHRGYCLELAIQDADWHWLLPHRVFYSDSRPVVSTRELLLNAGRTTPPPGYMERVFLTKDKTWAYESERRIIRAEGVGPEPIRTGILAGVVVGARMSREDEQRLRAWVSDRKVEWYRSHLSKDTFRVDVVRDA